MNVSVHEPFKSRFSVSYGSVLLLDSVFTDFENQKL